MDTRYTYLYLRIPISASQRLSMRDWKADLSYLTAHTQFYAHDSYIIISCGKSLIAHLKYPPPSHSQNLPSPLKSPNCLQLQLILLDSMLEGFTLALIFPFLSFNYRTPWIFTFYRFTDQIRIY